MAEGKVKYGSKKFKKMLNELCKEAAELSEDHNCKVGIFLAPRKNDEKSPIYAFGSPSVESVVAEWKGKGKANAEKREQKKLMANLNIAEGNGAAAVCGSELGGARVAEGANFKHEG